MRCSKKSILSLLLCFSVFIGSFIIFPDSMQVNAALSEEQVEQYENDLEDLKSQQAEIKAEISELESKKSDQNSIKLALQKNIDNIQSQISVCNNRIKSFDNQIKQNQQDVADKELELSELKDAFKRRIRAIYMSGGTTVSSLSILLGAEDFADLLSKSEVTKSISEYDSNMMAKIVEETEIIAAKETEILALKAEQDLAKAELEDKKSELNSEMSKINSDISSTSSEIGSLESDAKKLEAAMKELEEDIAAASDKGSSETFSGQFTIPVPGYKGITSPYGYRWHPISHKYKFHSGIDIAGSNIKGKPIVATADGVVSIAKYNSGGFGYYVMINHGTYTDGASYQTLYGHMTKYIVSAGQSVKKGQTIGYVGTTGASTGYHLHYEIRKNGKTVNPVDYFPKGTFFYY